MTNRLFRQALDDIRALTAKTDSRAFRTRLAAALCPSRRRGGVYSCLPKTCVSGATRWVGSDKAIIQLSLRYKTNDHLWFTFFHEAGHILLHGKKELFIEGVNGMDVKRKHRPISSPSKSCCRKRPSTISSHKRCLVKRLSANLLRKWVLLLELWWGNCNTKDCYRRLTAMI